MLVNLNFGNWNCLIVTDCDWLWLIVTDCDWLWLIVTDCDWLWLIVTDCGWLWLIYSGVLYICAFVISSEETAWRFPLSFCNDPKFISFFMLFGFVRRECSTLLGGCILAIKTYVGCKFQKQKNTRLPLPISTFEVRQLYNLNYGLMAQNTLQYADAMQCSTLTVWVIIIIILQKKTSQDNKSGIARLILLYFGRYTIARSA